MARSTPLTLPYVEAAFGKTLLHAIESFPASNTGSVEKLGLGARHFLGWLSTRETMPETTLQKLLRSPQDSVLTQGQVRDIVVLVMNRWRDDMLSDGHFRRKTLQHYLDHAISFFAGLGETQLGYPSIGRRFVSFPREIGDVATLGTSDDSHTTAVPFPVKERRALDRVRAEAMSAFLREERLFLAGKRILDGELRGQSPEAEAVYELLSFERDSWRQTGRSQFSSAGKRPPSLDSLVTVLASREAWLKAGFPEDSLRFMDAGTRLNIRKRRIAMLAIGCVGPTFPLVVSAMVAFCCDTGWNRQTISDLPRHPFVYRSSTQAGIAVEAFVESFKKRAGHHVLAYLDRSPHVSGLVEESARNAWSVSTQDQDPNNTMDGHTLLRGDSPLLDLLDRFEMIAGPARAYDLSRKREEFFFGYMSLRAGFAMNTIDIRGSQIDAGFERSGVTFQSIRKTFLTLKVREVGSMEAAMPFAGHRDGSILGKHYLTSSDMKIELDESIRFFQNSIQSLAVPVTKDNAVRIGMKPEDMEWFRRLADVSCISAACGLLPSNEEILPSKDGLKFNPSDDNLIELFLAHRALVRARTEIGHGRWQVQGLPLLACVKAIGRTLFRNGLGPAYRAAARKAERGLAAGLVVLPIVLEH